MALGFLGWAGLITAGLVGTAVVGGLVLYAIDYRIDATVEATACDLGQVKVRTKSFGIDHTVQGVPASDCAQLEPGDFVQYRIRTQRTTVYDEEGGRCMYDSKTGPDCGGSGGGILGLG